MPADTKDNLAMGDRPAATCMTLARQQKIGARLEKREVAFVAAASLHLFVVGIVFVPSGEKWLVRRHRHSARR